MSAQEINWQTFGFPNIVFMPAWKPAEGVMKALAERLLPFAEKWDLDTIAKSDQIKFLTETPNGQQWCRSFDEELQRVAVRYLNHTKMTDLSNVDFSAVMWSLEDLLLAAADNKKEKIVDPAKGDLSPEWNSEFLIQRYKAVNLLQFAPVPFKSEVKSGSTHTGVPSSPAESMAAALSAVQPVVSTGGLPATYVRNIYGPDHGWREGSYCCEVYITTKIFVELQEGFTVQDNLFLLLKATGADGSDDTLKAGGKISAGYNIFTADKEGVFITFETTDKDLANLAEIPKKDRETFGGWRSTICQAYANYNHQFHFKEEKKENDEDLL